MAPTAKLLISVLAFCFIDASAACDNCVVDDDMALHQHALRLRSLTEETGPEPEKPSKSMIQKVKPEIKEIMDASLKRVTAKAHLPPIPAVFRWELVGKATQWGLHLYEKPRAAASRELLEGLLDMIAEVVERKDFIAMEDAAIQTQLGNITKLHKLVRHYAEQRGAPPAVTKLVDATAQAAEHTGSLDPDSASKMLIDVANETSGPDLAELIDYSNKVAQGKESLDAAHIGDLYTSVFQKFGAPPSVVEYMKTSTDMMRNKVQPDMQAENLRIQRMFAKAATELNLPSAIAEIFDYTAEQSGSKITQPEEGAKVVVHLNELFAKLNEQLGGPAAISELMIRSAAPLLNQTAPAPTEVMGLLSQASKQMNLPHAVADLFDYMVEMSVKQTMPDEDKLRMLVEQLTEQVGAPEPLAKFTKDLQALSAAAKSGKPDNAKLIKTLTQLLKKLGMPAMADIFAKIVGPVMIKGKKPDPIAIAAVTPSLTKVLPDLETAHGIVQDMRKKLFSPLMALYEQVVERLTGQMPESTLKSALKHVLALARPPA